MLLIQLLVFGICAFLIGKVWFNHPLRTHWIAIKKSFFLWLMSFMPIIFLVFIGTPTGTDQIHLQLLDRLKAQLSIGEIFVYSASLLPPAVYLVWELVEKLKSGENMVKDIDRHFRGIEGVFVLAVIMLLFTAFMYAATKSGAVDIENSYFGLIFANNVLIIYFVSLCVWYTVILRDSFSPADIGSTQSRETNAFADELKKRVGLGA